MESYCIQKAIDCAGRNQSKHLEGFKALLRIPSISLDAAYQPQLRACADFILGEMELIGLQDCQLLPTAGNPILYADCLGAGADKPTILIHAHYDVQPVGDASLWKSPPFEPTLVDDRLVARGAVDDKCGIWINLKAIESILSACGELPINVKLFFEGEEELGSKNVGPALAANRDLLAADAVIISDGPFSPAQPVIGYALRGTIMGEVRVKGPPHDLHSGRYGGAVKNPIHYLGSIISSFHDASGRVQIKGFYDGIIPMTDRQRRHLNQLWKTIGPPLQKAAGVDAFFGDYLGVFAERTTSLPTLDVNGISGRLPGRGNTRHHPGGSRLQSDDAHSRRARFRQDVVAFRRACHGICRAGNRPVETELISIAHPFLMSDEGREIRAIQRALKSVIGKEALLMRHGGSLAIGGLLGRELDAPVTMFGYGSGDNSHAPNEFIYADHIQVATEVAISLLFQLGSDA